VTSEHGSEHSIWDVAVVGAGPAGSTVAALAARCGLRTLLIERDEFPRDKLCGEFLSGEAFSRLEEIGALDEVLALEPPSITRAVFTAAPNARVEVDLPIPAIGISRWSLDHAIARAAQAAGATLLEGATVRHLEVVVSGTSSMSRATRLTIDHRLHGPEGPRHEVEFIDTRLAVLAQGRRAKLDEAIGRSASGGRAHVGLKRHSFAAPTAAGAELSRELDGAVEIHAFRGGYCGLSFVEHRKINVCLLISEERLRSCPSKDWDAVIADISREQPFLARRVAALVPASEVLAVAKVAFDERERAFGPWPIVGDAACASAPFSGDGQSMAIESAALLGELIAERHRGDALSDPIAFARAWDTIWRRRVRWPLWIARTVQRVLVRPGAARFVTRIVALWPWLGRQVFRVTRARRAKAKISAASGFTASGTT
jgi:flavin-dependent dehydrogenase